MNFITLHILTFGHCMQWLVEHHVCLLRMWNFVLHNYSEQVKSWLIRHRMRSSIAIGLGVLFALLCFIYFISTMTMFFVFLHLPMHKWHSKCVFIWFPCEICAGSFLLCEFRFFYTIKLPTPLWQLTLTATREQRLTVWHLYVLWLFLPYLHFFSVLTIGIGSNSAVKFNIGIGMSSDFISNIFFDTQNKHSQIIIMFERVFNYATIDVLFLFYLLRGSKVICSWNFNDFIKNI